MFTEGNEYNEQQVYRIDTNENDSTNMVKNNNLDSEYEPVGSQQYQYNGQFVPYLPPMKEIPQNEEEKNETYA